MDPVNVIGVAALSITLLLVVVLLVRVSGRNAALQQQIATMQTALADVQARTTGLDWMRRDLTAMQSHLETRRELDQQAADSLRRLEAVIAGTRSKGEAGENIIEAVFAQLPPEWQVRNFTVGNKPVEFGLRLPNGLVLPVDSKWAATELLEQFNAAEDPAQQQRLKRQIERVVKGKAREVKQYLDPDLTMSFGVAVLPDAVYDLCGGIMADAFAERVVLISYSLFVPYLLLVYQTTLHSTQTVDFFRLENYLSSVDQNLTVLQDEVENRLSRTLVMLENSRDEVRTQLGAVRSGLESVRLMSQTITLPDETPAADPRQQAAHRNPLMPDSLPEAPEAREDDSARQRG